MSSRFGTRRAVRRLAVTGLGALLIGAPGLACGEKDEPPVTTPQTTSTPTVTTPTAPVPTTTAPPPTP